MKNLYKIQDELYIIDNNEKVTQNGIWAICSFTGDILKNRNGQYAHKVILTTNKLLIKDGVQSIDDEFLEWFVKNPKCEEVETKLVEFEVDMGLGESCIEYGSYYEIIIPKEEPKQETLEEVKDLSYWKINAEGDYLKVPISVLRYINEIEKRQEKMYSEEEVIEFTDSVLFNKITKFLKNPKEVLQQFKNK